MSSLTFLTRFYLWIISRPTVYRDHGCRSPHTVTYTQHQFRVVLAPYLLHTGWRERRFALEGESFRERRTSQPATTRYLCWATPASSPGLKVLFLACLCLWVHGRRQALLLPPALPPPRYPLPFALPRPHPWVGSLENTCICGVRILLLQPHNESMLVYFVCINLKESSDVLFSLFFHG